MSNAQGPAASGIPANLPASPVNRLIEQFRSKPIVPLVIAGAGVVAVVGAMLLWAQAPEYKVIYANLGEAEGGRIISELEKRGVPYRLGAGGQTLLVPAEQMHALRLQLAEQGLPKNGNVGLELMDSQAFGISQFAEQVNFQRGLEGELARSIESLGPVENARVHLVMAKQSVFVRERAPASASVVLSLHPGRELGEGQVAAIAHLISSSVPGLAAESVTVVDQSGRMLSQPAAGPRDLDGTQLKYIEEVERSYQRRIENILAPILGAANVRAQVVAQIDFANREQTAERFGPNQPPNEAAVRSQQLSEDYTGGDELARGVPGALTNTPPNSQLQGGAAGSNPQRNGEGEDAQAKNGQKPPSRLSRDNLINYEVDRSVEHVQHRRGNIQRLSAAVVINYRETVNEEGKTVRAPLSDAEMERINRVVRQAMGFTAARGDEVEVINSEFADSTETVEEVAWWKTPEFLSLAMGLGKYLLIAVMALILWASILRPMQRRHAQTVEAEAAAKAAAIAAAASAEQEALSAEAVADGKPAVRRKSAIYEHNLESLRDIAQKDPRMVAMIIRGWMTKDE